MRVSEACHNTHTRNYTRPRTRQPRTRGSPGLRGSGPIGGNASTQAILQTSPSVYATLLQCFERLDQVEVLRFQSYSPADYRMIPLLQRHDQGRPALLPKLKLAVFGSSIARSKQFKDLQRHGMICGTRVAEIRAVEDGLGELGARRIYDELIGPFFDN